MHAPWEIQMKFNENDIPLYVYLIAGLRMISGLILFKPIVNFDLLFQNIPFHYVTVASILKKILHQQPSITFTTIIEVENCVNPFCIIFSGETYQLMQRTSPTRFSTFTISVLITGRTP